tara:strand:+ start:151 stop:912 length:762 start_codon:yes stop_codon:yes gene_type:complete
MGICFSKSKIKKTVKLGKYGPDFAAEHDNTPILTTDRQQPIEPDQTKKIKSNNNENCSSSNSSSDAQQGKAKASMPNEDDEWAEKRAQILATTPGKAERTNDNESPHTNPVLRFIFSNEEDEAKNDVEKLKIVVQGAIDTLCNTGRQDPADFFLQIGTSKDLAGAIARYRVHVAGASNIGKAYKGDIAIAFNVNNKVIFIVFSNVTYQVKLEALVHGIVKEKYKTWNVESSLGVHEGKYIPTHYYYSKNIYFF